MRKTRKILLLALAVAAALAATALPAAPSLAATSEALGVWTSNGTGGWSFQNVTAAVGGTSITGEAKPIIDGHGVIHVYASSPSGDLLEFIQGQPGQWTVTDLSSLVGGATIATDPTPLLLHGSAGVDIQVFALNSAGHLLSFVEGNNNPGVWSVYDLTALSGSTATLPSTFTFAGPNPSPSSVGAIQVGNDLHIYAIDNNLSLHDFVKTPTSNWVDVNLSAIACCPPQPNGQVSANGVPAPFAYGGNSIQITALDFIHNSRMGTFVEGVQPDGSLTGSPAFYDIGAPASSPSFQSVDTVGNPLVFGANNQDVGVFSEDSAIGRIVEFFKAPTANWTTDVVGQVGPPGGGVAALLAGGQTKIFAMDQNDQLQMFTSPTPVSGEGPGPWSNVNITEATGAGTVSVPNALFIPQTGQTMVFSGH